MKLEKGDESGNESENESENKNVVINVRDVVQTKSKNAYTKKLGRSYWLRRHHEMQFLKAVFKHVSEGDGLSIAGILNYVKSGEFEDDIMAELIKREGIENEKRKELEERKVMEEIKIENELRKKDAFENAKRNLKEMMSI